MIVAVLQLEKSGGSILHWYLSQHRCCGQDGVYLVLMSDLPSSVVIGWRY